MRSSRSLRRRRPADPLPRPARAEPCLEARPLGRARVLGRLEPGGVLGGPAKLDRDLDELVLPEDRQAQLAAGPPLLEPLPEAALAPPEAGLGDDLVLGVEAGALRRPAVPHRADDELPRGAAELGPEPTWPP